MRIGSSMADALQIDPGPVTTLTVDRPDKLNSLTVETLHCLEEAIAEAREEARVLVLTGAGDDAFIAGADISYMQSLEPAAAQDYSELGHAVANGLESFPGPTIAAINGYALGGGCELAIACDLRIASERAVIGQPEVELGIFPGWGGTQRLPRLVGDEMARRLIYLGDRVDAQDANEIGLVGEVVAHDELEERVSGMAQELAAKPRLAIRAAKEALNLERHGDPEAGLAYERRAWSGLFGTPDQREGMAAFLKDREPDFE